MCPGTGTCSVDPSSLIVRLVRLGGSCDVPWIEVEALLFGGEDDEGLRLTLGTSLILFLLISPNNGGRWGSLLSRSPYLLIIPPKEIRLRMELKCLYRHVMRT